MKQLLWDFSSFCQNYEILYLKIICCTLIIHCFLIKQIVSLSQFSLICGNEEGHYSVFSSILDLMAANIELKERLQTLHGLVMSHSQAVYRRPGYSQKKSCLLMGLQRSHLESQNDLSWKRPTRATKSNSCLCIGQPQNLHHVSEGVVMQQISVLLVRFSCFLFSFQVSTLLATAGAST